MVMNETTPEILIARLEDQLERGQLWKAKELAGTYSGIMYDPVLWRACGEVLLRGEDRHRAGKLLFFAGSKDSAHREAVDLYLHRADPVSLQRDVYGLRGTVDLPDAVTDVFREWGVDPTARPVDRRRVTNDEGGWLLGCILPTVFLVVMAGGIYKVYEWVMLLFR